MEINLGSLKVWVHQTQSPQARVLLVHGICEHSGRHQNTIDFLVSRNIEVVRFDLRGFGLSGGIRQYVEAFDEYVEDVNTVFIYIRNELEKLPTILYGHSMGGAVSIRFASLRSHELSGLVLSAPAFLLGASISKIKVMAAKTLSKWLPKAKVPSSVEWGTLSRIKKVEQEYVSDPLACHFNTFSQGVALLKILPQTLQLVPEITCPTLLVHGSLDKVVSIEGSFQIFKALKCASKDFYIVKGGYHEPHNDLDKEAYFKFLHNWILNTVKSS